MGERRKRKSLWDMEEETKHFSGTSKHNSWTEKEHHSSHDSGGYHEFSASRTYTAPTSRDYSGQPSWESMEVNPVSPMSGSFVKGRQNAPEGKELGGGNRYYQNMSPGFDEMEPSKYNNSLENDRGHSQRYLGRARSRSRSRSMPRGRSRSRSLSRGRGRERRKGRSRSRSRSRSLSDGAARGQNRNRSPIVDYRHQSYGWSERNVPDKSTQICKDFASGRCRRGNQCRFFHPKTVSHEDGDFLGDDAAESWRNRADRGHVSKHAYNRGTASGLRDDVSDHPYHREDEQFQNKSRSAVPCRNFVKGSCRWGDACRFSHHFSSDETFGKGARYASFDNDMEHESGKNGKTLCKYFAAGKCDRDNCRFSHEDPKLNSLEGRRVEVIKTANDTVDTTAAKNDSRWGRSLENENASWGVPEWTINSVNQDKQPSPLGAIGKENIANKQDHLILHGLQLQNQDGDLNVHGQNRLLEDQGVPMKAWHRSVSPVEHIQQQDRGVVENILVSSLQSDVLDEMNENRNTSNPILFSGQNLNQIAENVFPGQSSISNETDGGQNVLRPNPLNGFGGDLNLPETHLAVQLSLQSQMQNHQKAVQMTGMLETKVPHFFPNLLKSEHSAQANSSVSIDGQQVAPVTNPTMFPTQRFTNEQSQKIANTEVSNSRGMTSFSDTPGHVPVVYTMNVASNIIKTVDNGRDTNEQENHTEHDNQVQLARSSPLLVVGREPDNLKVDHHGNPKPTQEGMPANSELDGGNRGIGEESKGPQNNKHSETLDGHGKVEESTANKDANKDDKVMRIFKNSLIEFVKDILKPTWKEGRMSREDHKTIVKKVVDKVTGTIQADQIPKTQDKVEQYLLNSKPKIAKLVQAYVGRCMKKDS